MTHDDPLAEAPAALRPRSPCCSARACLRGDQRVRLRRQPVAVQPARPSCAWAGPSDPDSLNPFIGFLQSSYEVWALNYDYLVGVDAADLSRPQGLDKATGLAYQWSHTPDGLVWTFKVRSGVKWQDGVAFTAARRRLHLQLHDQRATWGTSRATRSSSTA